MFCEWIMYRKYILFTQEYSQENVDITRWQKRKRVGPHLRRRWRSSLNDVKVWRGAEVESDHHLVRGKMKLKLEKIPQGQAVKPFAVEN